MFKSNGEALKGGGAALKSDEEAVKGGGEAFKVKLDIAMGRCWAREVR